MSVINSTDDAEELIFQTALDIPPAQGEQALRTLARAGASLFQKLFRPHDGSAELRELGDHLCAIGTAPDTTLLLQIVTKEFAVPWGMLYLGNASAAAPLSWEKFVGFRHIVEQLPLQASFTEQSQQIASDQPALAVTTTMNGAIDTTMEADFVARQQQFWTETSAAGAHLRLTRRDRRDEVLQALASGDNKDQILYFYCHASAPALGAPGGLDAASIGLSDATISLQDLNLDAPTTSKLGGSPLVFINACESAELSPQFYEGFVPYFMAKGARGVIGTECKTPALFAAAWGQRFFERFLAGETLGAAFLALRREFLLEHGNPLGILYGVHCDGDTQIQPALASLIPTP
jgi:hypothetical protein